MNCNPSKPASNSQQEVAAFHRAIIVIHLSLQAIRNRLRVLPKLDRIVIHLSLQAIRNLELVAAETGLIVIHLSLQAIRNIEKNRS